MAVKYWRTLATGNWSANTSWQYYDGAGWTAAPAGSTPGTNYPGTNDANGDHVLIQGAHRITLDTNIDIKTLTNIQTGFPLGTGPAFTALASGSGVVYSANRTLTCNDSSSVAGTADTNISATTFTLIHPIASGFTLTLGTSSNPVKIRGLLAGTTAGTGTVATRDYVSGTNYNTTFNVWGNIYGGTTFPAIQVYISTSTINVDGVITAALYGAISVENATLTLNVNGSITPSGTVSAIVNTSGTPNINLNTKSGGSLFLYGGGSTGQIIGNANAGNFTINMTGGEITALSGSTPPINFTTTTVTTLSITLDGTAVSASSTASAIYLGTIIPSVFSLINSCVVTSTTARNAIASQRLNATQPVKFKFNDGSSNQNTFQASALAQSWPAAQHVLAGTATYSDGSTTYTPTLTFPQAATVFTGVYYGIGQSLSNTYATVGTLDVWSQSVTPYNDPTKFGGLINQINTNVIAAQGVLTTTNTNVGGAQAVIGTVNTNVSSLQSVTGTINTNLTSAQQVLGNVQSVTLSTQGTVLSIQSTGEINKTNILGAQAIITKVDTEVMSIQTVTGAINTNVSSVQTVLTTTNNNVISAQTVLTDVNSNVNSVQQVTGNIQQVTLSTQAVVDSIQTVTGSPQDIANQVWSDFDTNPNNSPYIQRVHNVSTVDTTGQQISTI